MKKIKIKKNRKECLPLNLAVDYKSAVTGYYFSVVANNFNFGVLSVPAIFRALWESE